MAGTVVDAAGQFNRSVAQRAQRHVRWRFPPERKGVLFSPSPPGPRAKAQRSGLDSSGRKGLDPHGICQSSICAAPERESGAARANLPRGIAVPKPKHPAAL